MAHVAITAEAKEDIRALDGSAQKLVLKAITKLAEEPAQRGKPLGSRASGNLTGLRSLVVGNRQYRVVYQVEGDGSVCVVWVVGSRVDAECYDTARARIELYARDRELAQALQGLLDTAFNRPSS